MLYRWSSGPEADGEPETLDDEAQKLAEVMAQRILEQRVEARLIAQTQAHPISGNISNTQLSRMRIIARRALGSDDLDDIKQFLDNLPSNAREQFARARVHHQPLDTWIRSHLKPVPTEWDSERLTVAVASVTREPDHQMQQDFTLRLLMAMVRQKVKGNERD
jgi:CRISPR-associated protein Csx10